MVADRAERSEAGEERRSGPKDRRIGELGSGGITEDELENAVRAISDPDVIRKALLAVQNNFRKPADTLWAIRAERAEADVEKLKMDAEHLQYERDEAREKLAAMEADVDSLGDLPSSWPTNEAESEALRQERGMAQVRESSSPPPVEPGLRDVGWLIEAPGPQWWDGFWFCTDSMDAVRFSRKLDAEKVIRETVEQVPTIQPIEFLAVEHAWSDVALARTLPQKQGDGWRLANVEPPKETGEYLVFITMDDGACFDTARWSPGWSMPCVTHWMPLPAAPRDPGAPAGKA
jgi:hypothetical protein